MKVHVFRLVENSEAEVIIIMFLIQSTINLFRVQFMRNHVIHGSQSWLTSPAGLIGYILMQSLVMSFILFSVLPLWTSNSLVTNASL